MMNISAVLSVFKDYASSVSALVAVIALSISMYTMYQTNVIAKKKIDADIKAKSRIDWIQKVREATVNVESCYRNYYLARSSNLFKKSEALDKDLEEMITRFESSVDILILYFSTDSDKEYSFNIKNELYITIYNKVKEDSSPVSIEKIKKEVDNARSNNKFIIQDLLDSNRRDNSGLNGLIIAYLKNLKVIVSEKFYYDNVEYGVVTLDSKEYMIKDYFFNKDREIISGYVEQLITVISIYLKKEWDIAKSGN